MAERLLSWNEMETVPGLGESLNGEAGVKKLLYEKEQEVSSAKWFITY